MRCPKCKFENKDNALFCDFCGTNLNAAKRNSPIRDSVTDAKGRKKRYRPQGKFINGLRRLLEGIFNLILYIILIIICAAVILSILFSLCLVNVPNAPSWKFLPDVVAEYWEKLDDWQMERCPDLTPDNSFFIPKSGNGNGLDNEADCKLGILTFSPTGAPAGASFEISMDDFTPQEVVKACWFFPSSKMENCIDIEMDENGHAKTAYFSESNYPKGSYTMEADGSCGKVIQEFTLE